MIWLIFSILCSTLIFVVFKLFGRWNMNNLQAIVINYVVAFSVGWLSDGFVLEAATLVQKDWFASSLILGVMFISLFQLMAVVAQQLGVAIVSVSVKMALVIPVIFAISFYGDSTGVIKIAGIVLALLAVYLATRPSNAGRSGQMAFIWPLLLFLGSGFLDAFLKYNQQELVPQAEHAYFTSILFAMAGFCGILWYAISKALGMAAPLRSKNLLGGLLLGIPNYGSIYFLIRALDQPHLESSAIFPVNNVGIVALSVIAGRYLFAEKLSPANRWGIILALLAIILIGWAQL